MAQKLTHETDWSFENGNETRSIIITGTQRQPTIIEALNYINENSLDDYNGLLIIGVNNSGDYYSKEDYKSIEFLVYTDHCPTCNKIENMDLDICPVCKRNWNE